MGSYKPESPKNLIAQKRLIDDSIDALEVRIDIMSETLIKTMRTLADLMFLSSQLDRQIAATKQPIVSPTVQDNVVEFPRCP